MNHRKYYLMATSPAFMALLFISFEAAAQARFVQPGSFVVLTPCQAFDSIRNQTGAVNLEVDQAYAAYGENKAPGGTHAHIGVASSRKWVSLECGDYQGQRPDFVGQGDGSPENTQCLSFFDDQDNPVQLGGGVTADITPQAPTIEPFGQAVLAVCGAPGKETSAAEFKQLLLDHPQVLAQVMAYTQGKVFANRPTRSDTTSYLDDLTDAWYGADAFDHIFCGETKGSDSIGGLHYQGRYQQLQASGDACRVPNFQQNEVAPGAVYTMGARMQRPSGGWAESDYKGYGLTLSAADLLKAATRAFAENPAPSDTNAVCIQALDDGGTQYNMVFVRRASGIRTFYPDATPGATPDCAHHLVLEETGAGGGTQPKSLTAGRFRIQVIAVDDKGVTLRIDEAE